MKAFVLALLTLGTSLGFADVPFPGNDSDGGVSRPHGQLDPYTGNFSFATRDIVVAGAVGRYALTWARHASSRTSESAPWFGLGHSWTQNWQWELVDEGNDSQGRAVVSVREPEGWVHRFTETSPGAWWSAPSVRDRIVSDGDQFRLLRFDASEVQFSRQMGLHGAVFVARAVIDPEGNVWKLDYDAGRLVRVTEPAGRWLQVSYASLVAPGAAKGAEPFTVIQQVAASDGQVVEYDYAFPGGADYPVLSGASYPDGTKATYAYAAPRQGARRLLTQAVDPRANRYVRGRVFIYRTETDAPVGQLAEIRTADKGEVLQALAPDGAKTRGYAVRQDNGATVYRTYNAGGNVEEKIDALGYAKKFDYDNGGRGWLTATTDELGHVTRRENGAFGMAVKQTWPDGSVSTWRRDDRGRMLAETNELGSTKTYTRDGKGRVTKISNPDGTVEQIDYNSFGQVVARTRPDRSLTTLAYDDRGLVLKVTNALGYARAFNYDAQDRLAAITDPRGNTISYVHDAAGHVIRTVYSDGTSLDRAYDEFGLLIKTTDAAGIVRTQAYDSFGRLTATHDALGREARALYAEPGNGAAFVRPIATVNRSGRKTATTYDANGHVTAVTIAAGTRLATTTRYSYDPVGHRASVTDPRGKTVQYFYDERGRRAKTMNALNFATTWTYDAAGRKLTQTDAKGHTTRWTYDAMGRELTKTDALGQVTARTYDTSGHLVTLTDPKGHAYRFAYDGLGRPTALQFPDGSRETNLYDEVGNKQSFTNRAGVTRSFTYDDRNREIRSEWSDGSQTIVKAYDAAGRMILEDNGVSKITYAFDATGRLAAETQDLAPIVTEGRTDPAPRTVTYTYAADGQRESIGYPDGTSVKFNYNARGQLQNILGDGGPPPIASYAYDEGGNATEMPRENLTNTVRAFDDANHVVSILDESAAAGPLHRTDYTYDAVDDRTTAVTTDYAGGPAGPAAAKDSYSYDATHQLTGVEHRAPVAAAPAASVRFTYDAVGNRITVAADGRITRYAVNQLNEYAQVGDFAPAYDRNGNLAGMHQWLYRFDALNRLVSASDGTTTATFFYDAKNRCVARQYNHAVTLNYYAHWNLIAEYDPAGDEMARYVQGRHVDELVLIANRSGVFYPHRDALGNVVLLTDTTGRLVEKYNYAVDGRVTIYDAAGHPLPASAVGNRFMFTGREWLPEIGLYDYRNRVYSPELGRFLQVDPLRLGAEDINVYRYAANSYPNRGDPNGEGLVGAVIDGTIGFISGAIGAYDQGGNTWQVVRDGAIGGIIGLGVGLIDPTEGVISSGLIGAAVGAFTDAYSQSLTYAENNGTFDGLASSLNYESISVSAVSGFAGTGFGMLAEEFFTAAGAAVTTWDAEAVGAVTGGLSEMAFNYTLNGDYTTTAASTYSDYSSQYSDYSSYWAPYYGE